MLAPAPVALNGITFSYGEGELRRPVLRDVQLDVAMTAAH